jgi:aminoglycoside/choline kinase family phosphotransferase
VENSESLPDLSHFSLMEKKHRYLHSAYLRNRGVPVPHLLIVDTDPGFYCTEDPILGRSQNLQIATNYFPSGCVLI